MDERELKLNSLARYSKTSPLYVLEHGHCEVPAGCGGVVFAAYYPPPADEHIDVRSSAEQDVGVSVLTAADGMAGSVWEWTADWYDAQYYGRSPLRSPTGPEFGTDRVLRGGSWADCAETATVSFRMSRPAVNERDGTPAWCVTPNVGLRLCRKPANVAAGQTRLL